MNIKLASCLLAITTLAILCADPAESQSTAAVPPASFTDPVTGMQFMRIPGGTFTMGSTQDPFAAPEHRVTVAPFLMGRHEVTFDQYAKFSASTGNPIPADNGWGFGSRPVTKITWNEAMAFAKWLSEKTGKKYRLPSEAEWEFAARGGATTRYPWGEQLGKNNAACQECGTPFDNKMTAPVGSFPPNGYGLYDMIGNVYEWSLDTWHDTSYKGAPADGSAWVGSHPDRVNRGGSWRQPAEELTITRRCWDQADVMSSEYGFRLVLEP